MLSASKYRPSDRQPKIHDGVGMEGAWEMCSIISQNQNYLNESEFDPWTSSEEHIYKQIVELNDKQKF